MRFGAHVSSSGGISNAVGRGLAISISGPAILYLAHAIRIAVERQSLDDVVIRNGLAGFALIALAVGVALVPGRLQNSVRCGLEEQRAAKHA